MNKHSLLALLSILLLLSSCGKDDPIIPNEEELITTLNLTLTPDGSGNSILLSFQDLDGDGGVAPIIRTSALQANTSYNATVEFLNEQESPAEDITLEVVEEGDEHQVFYSSSIPGVTVMYSDEDDMGNPVGISTVIETGDAGSGQLTITLRHEPSKTADGVSDGDITNAGGETDIEVTFDIDVE